MATGKVFRYKASDGSGYHSMSWNEFAAQSDLVSKALISLGFGQGSMIGIFSNNKPEWTISDIGILAIRGIVVPFFGNASKEQVKYIVDETEMKIMFVGNQEQLDKARWLLDNSGTLEKVILFNPVSSWKMTVAWPGKNFASWVRVNNIHLH